MPRLGNQRHEAFAGAYVRGEHAGNQRACYKAVYGRDDRQAASRLRQRDDISRRIAELQDRVAQIAAEATAKATEQLSITVDSLIQEADALKKAAVENKQISAAVSALTVKAKLAGLWIDHSVVRTPDPANAMRPMIDRSPDETREEWIERRRCEAAGKPYCTGRTNASGETAQQWLERRNRELGAIPPPSRHANGDPRPASGPLSLGDPTEDPFSSLGGNPRPTKRRG